MLLESNNQISGTLPLGQVFTVIKGGWQLVYGSMQRLAASGWKSKNTY
jgi:hypothetical protein